MIKYPLKNWIPTKIDFYVKELIFHWSFIGVKKFTEPFFQDTIWLCREYEENRKLYQGVSTFEGLVDFSENIPTVTPTAFIFHISRCGSTLLAQLLSLDDQNIILAEPPILDEILRETKFNKPDISENKIDESLKAVVKFLGQKRSGKEQRYIIKLDSWHILYYDKLRKLYPKTPFIFSFRRPDEVIRSHIKEPGMHASPGIIQPELFDFNLEEILKIERSDYIAKVLVKYFEKYLSIKNIDNNTLFINYNNGIFNNLNQIELFLNIQIEPSLKLKMEERVLFHSKRPNTVFNEKPLEYAKLEYQKKVFELYDKLIFK